MPHTHPKTRFIICGAEGWACVFSMKQPPFNKAPFFDGGAILAQNSPIERISAFFCYPDTDIAETSTPKD